MCPFEACPSCGYLAEEIKEDNDNYEEETGDFYERQTSWDNRD